MKKSLVEYLQYLQDSNNKQLAVSLAEFREYVAFHAVVSARDGNDYAVFNDGANYVTVVLSNSGFIGRAELLDFIPSGQGDVNIYAVFDDLTPAHEHLTQVMIYDNDLTGVYGSNVSSPCNFEPAERFKTLYPVAQWVEEVERGDTVLGYNEWLFHMIESNQA